jgi:hypothetical protein
MVPQEQVFFNDHTVYITNTRLVLRKGGTYPIANIAQVTLGRVSASRAWIGPLIFGFVFLLLGDLFIQNSALARYGVLLTGKPYLIIGGSLLLSGFIIALFHLFCPLYVVVLKGTFGIARPIRRRNRRSITRIIVALNEAISKREVPVVHSTYIDQRNQRWFNHSGGTIIDAQGHVNIGTLNNAQSGEPMPEVRWSDAAPSPFNGNSLHTLSGEAQSGLRVGPLDNSGIVNRDTQSRTRPASPDRADARKIIISYSQKDHQWLALLRTHLALLENQQLITLWDDTQITAGMQTQQAMSSALASADSALLLVSANFLASDVIMGYELPQIFQRHSRGRFALLPLLLSPCLYSESPLGQYQPLNPNSPLSMLPPPKQDDVLVRVAREIQKVTF